MICIHKNLMWECSTHTCVLYVCSYQTLKSFRPVRILDHLNPSLSVVNPLCHLHPGIIWPMLGHLPHPKVVSILSLDESIKKCFLS